MSERVVHDSESTIPVDHVGRFVRTQLPFQLPGRELHVATFISSLSVSVDQYDPEDRRR